MIETIAFDFGQVIGFFDHGRALSTLAPHTDMSIEEMFAALFGTDLEDEFESGRITEQEFLRRLAEACRLTCDHDHIATCVADIFWPNESLCALIPQLKQRYRIVLGSNTNSIHHRRFGVQFADTLRHFDARILSHEVGARKPARAFYEHVIRVAECPPERCVFIDDLAPNVAGAKACGMKGIVYSGMEELLAKLREMGVE